MIKKFIKSYSLVKNLRISLVIAVSIVSTTIVIISLLYDYKKAETNLENTAKNSVEYLSNILQVPMWNYDTKTVKIIGDTYSQDKSITKITILDTENNIFYEIKTNPQINDKVKSRNIIHEGRNVGKIIINFSSSIFINNLINFYRNVIIINILVIITIIITTGFLFRIFLKTPLKLLSDIVNSYSTGIYSNKVIEIPIIEFQPLGKVLEKMGNEISIQFNDLKFLNKNLEDRSKELLFKTEELEKFFTVNLDLLCIADTDGYFRRINTQWDEILGYTQNELINRKIINFVHPDDLEKTLESLKDLSNQKSVFNFINRFRCKDGTYRFIEWNSVAIEKNIYASARDISERIKIEKELINAKEIAENALLVKSQFLSNMSHEIRTPLNGIIGILTILEKTKLDKNQTKYISYIKRSGEMLLNIINDILDISKIESGKRELKMEDCDLKILCSNIININSIIAKEKNLDLNFNFDNRIKKNVICDKTIINQIIINLINNAIKFTKEGSVSFNVYLLKEINNDYKIKFEIKDTGIGIAQEKIEFIFDKFSQIDSSYSKKYAGTGLGLNIVKNLTILLNGFVDVESKIDEGSTFTVELFFKKSTNNVSVNNIEIFEEKLNNNIIESDYNILIAEDNFINLFFLESVLKNKGFNIKTANNGYEVLEILKSNKINLILLDIQMPDMDGLTCVNLIRKNKKTKNIKIIAVSGYSTEEDITNFAKFGIKEFIPKPIIEKDLIDKIYSILS